MRCTGSSSADCCVAFEDDLQCSPDLSCNKYNLVANMQNNFTCGESKLVKCVNCNFCDMISKDKYYGQEYHLQINWSKTIIFGFDLCGTELHVLVKFTCS